MKGKRILAIICSLIGVVAIIIGIMMMNNDSSNKDMKDEKWILSGSTVTKGEQSFQIGDYYEYDETNNGTIEGLTDVKWKVMGVDEDGNLLILSASNVSDMTLGKEDDLETSQQDYIEGISRLNELSKKYGKGVDALSARSITNQDINKITGYNPKNFPGYNTETTYYWGEEESPRYESSQYGSNTLRLSHNGIFVWYDQSKGSWVRSEKTGNETVDNPTQISTLTNTFYAYDNATYIQEPDIYSYLLEEDSPEFKMLYLDDEENNANYWTANAFVSASNLVAYGYSIMKHDGLNYTYIVYSPGITRETTAGMRAVVTID